MDGRAKRERPRGVESNPRRGDGRSTSDSHGGGNGGSDGYSRGSGRGGSHGDSHGHRHGHSRGPNPGPDRGLTYCDTRGNIAASNTALLAAPLRPKTRRQSRQHCGFKYGVNRDLIAASSLPHRCLIAASNSASITAAIVAVGFPSAYVAVQVEPLSVFSQEAAGLVHAAGAAVKAASGHELDGCVFCVLVCRGLDLQAQPFQAGRVGLE